MITSEIKVQLDEIYKNAPSVSFNKFVADAENVEQLDEDAKLLAIAPSNADDMKSYLVLQNDVYIVVDEVYEDESEITVVEDNKDLYSILVSNEDFTNVDEVEDITFEQLVLFQAQELTIPESNFYKMSEEDAENFPLS